MGPKKLMPMNKSETTVLWLLLKKEERKLSGIEWYILSYHFGCLSNQLIQNLADESLSKKKNNQKIVSET